MATIQIEKTYSMDKQQVRDGIEKLAESLKQEQGMQYQWINENKASFEHKTMKGFVEITDKAVRLELKIGMLFSAMAPMIKSKIQAAADQYIY